MPGVYSTSNGVPTRVQRAVAALLFAGPDAFLTGNIALWLYGFRSRIPDRVDTVVRHDRHRRSNLFAQVSRSARTDVEIVSRNQLPCAPVARAVADTCRKLDSSRAARAVVAEAVQRRFCTVEELRSELEAGPTQRSVLLRDALAEVEAGSRSVPESDFRRLIRGSSLPEPEWNVTLLSATGERIATPDAWWPDAGVAVEIDSRTWHLSPEDWEATMDRHARMTSYGINVIHVSPRQMRKAPQRLLGYIMNAYTAGCARPPLPIRTRACG